MKIGIPKEILKNENRTAATPETVAKMIKAGMDVYVQSGAGLRAHLFDNMYQEAGALIETTIESLFKQSNVILKVNPPTFYNNDLHEIDLIKEESILISSFSPMQEVNLMQKLNQKKVTSFSLNALPRIARAQSMDILSSMSNLAGYKSVVLAASYLGKILPMLTTAAGTIQPAKVIVIGAGVAGLQAIATARRLGGVVLAFDTRPIVEEQVKSLGADFVKLETSHDQAEDAYGYAKEQTADFYVKEQEMLSPYLKNVDIVITTALIPNKRAPLLITEQMVKDMKPGSVIVDLAVTQEGNCEISEPGKIVEKHGITIIGILNMPGTLPIHASQLFSNNILSFLNYISPQIKTRQFDFSDDIIKHCLITHDGNIVNPTVKDALKEKGY